jgi:hypothetical protein
MILRSRVNHKWDTIKHLKSNHIKNSIMIEILEDKINLIIREGHVLI